MKKTKSLKIHTENILPIIKKWLYSDRDIFVRELVSNACDALSKLKVLREKGETDAKDETMRVEIAIDTENKTLTFSDTGLGMDVEEVEKYIGDVAFSGAEEFAKKYESHDSIIGHFGLGFFSAFMVAKEVEIDTLSYKEDAKAVHWRSDGSSKYTLSDGKRIARGTTITLHLNAESEEFLEQARLRTILERYCAFLPYPIFLGESQLNKEEPLWTKAPSDCTDEEYKTFYRTLYPFEEEPLFWIHLSVDVPFHLQGVLYFPRIGRDFEFKKETVRLFCNRVFVSDNCKEVLPEYLTMLRGVIDSPDIPLNVSRSSLQVDRTVRSVAGHISKKVADKLSGLFNTDLKRYLKCWEDLELIVKLGALQDDKFYERVQDLIVWQNTDGEWKTLKDYLEGGKEKVYYTNKEGSECPFLSLYLEKGIEVLKTRGPIDAHLIPFLERKTPSVKFVRIDGALDESLVDKEREKTLLDGEGKTDATRLAEFVKETLGEENLEVEAKSLATESLPAFIVLDEEMRRMRDIMAMSSTKEKPPFMGKKTLVINTNSKLMGAIQSLYSQDALLAKELLRNVYDQARLSGREMEPGDLDAFIAQSHSVLEKLAILRTEAPTT